MKHIAFIINPSTQRVHLLNKKKVLEAFSAEEYKIEFFETEYHNHAREITINLVKDNVDIIVAVGGAGTINQILQEIIFTPHIKLAIFPTGCGNGYAHYIDLPFHLKPFLKTLKEEFTQKVDIAEVKWDNNKKYFLSYFCVGATAKLAKENEGIAFPYFFYYPMKTMQSLWNYKPNNNYTVEFNKKKEELNFYEIMIGNLPTYKGTLRHKSYSSVRDGFLDINIIRSIKFTKVCSYVIKNLFENFNDNLFKKDNMHQAKSVYLSFDKETLAHADLEPFTIYGDVKISNLKHHLELITPQNNIYI